MNKINLARSIECYQNALSVTDRKQHPFRWAEFKNSLGNALKQNGQYEEAIKCFKETLEIHTRTDYPTDYMKTLLNLGNAHVENKNLIKAFKSYQEVINTLEEDLLSQLATDDDAKRKLGEVWINSYQYMISVCLKLGKENPDYCATAWEYVERSKARRLVEIFGQTKPNDISDQTWREFMNLRNEVTNTEKWIEDNEKLNILLDEKSFNDSELTNRKNNLTNLKQKLTKKLENYPQLKRTPKVEYISFSQIGKKLSDDNTVIIQWYILASDQKFCAFIYTRQSYQPYVWESSFEDLKNLLELFREYFRSYNSNPDQWRYQLPKYLERLAKILHIDDLVNYLYKNHQNCQQVILIPHLDLHLFPIHALPVKSVNANQPEYFFECFTKGVRYAPSCQTLLMLEKRLKNRNDFNDPKFEHLFAVQNPTSDLIYPDLEVKAIEKYFNTADILVNKDAKKQKIIDNKLTSVAHCVHFSCHGTFKLESPIDSALILANNEHLTLLDIFKLNLNQCRLVTLSACETGITDLTSITDEYIGLPSGFLFSGSQNVVSSLWTVNDLSTAFLMIKFYQILLDPTQQVSVAIAIKTAQNWLRTLNREKFIFESNQIIDKLNAKKPRMAESYRKIAKQLLLQNTEEYPFQNPYYWAAFIASGQ
jgi:CHAT domain-containing protein